MLYEYNESEEISLRKPNERRRPRFRMILRRLVRLRVTVARDDAVSGTADVSRLLHDCVRRRHQRSVGNSLSLDVSRRTGPVLDSEMVAFAP